LLPLARSRGVGRHACNGTPLLATVYEHIVYEYNMAPPLLVDYGYGYHCRLRWRFIVIASWSLH